MADLEPISINFVAGGVAELKQILTDFIDQSARFADELNKAFEMFGKSARKNGAKATEGIEKSGKEILKQVEKAGKAKVASEEKAAAATLRAQEKAAQAEIKAADKAAAAVAKAEAKKTAQQEKEAQKRTAAVEREAARQVAAERRMSAQVSREIAKEQKEKAGFRGKVAGTMSGGITSALGAASSLVGMVGGLGGGLAMGDALNAQIGAEKAAASFSVASGGDIKTEDALRSANEISRKHGIENTSVLEGMQSFTAKTGNAKMGLENADFMAKISKSQGIDIKEVAALMGTFSTQNQSLKSEDLQKMILAAAGQAKAGSVEIADMAKALSKVTASAGGFEGNQMENMTRLAGLVQAGAKGTGSAEEAATSVSMLSSDFSSHKDQFRALGVDPFTKGGAKLKNINETLISTISKTKGNQEQLAPLFGESSRKTVNVLASEYNRIRDKTMAETKGTKAEKENAGDKAAEQGLRKYMEELQNASLTVEQLDKDYRVVSETVSEKTNKSFNEVKIMMGEKLLPEFAKLVPVIGQLVPWAAKAIDVFVKIAQFAENNPLTAAFTGMAALVTKSIAEAFAADMIKGLLEKSLANPALVAGIGAVVIALKLFSDGLDKVNKFNDKKNKEGKETYESKQKEIDAVQEQIDKPKNGPLTAEELQGLEAKKAELVQERDDLAKQAKGKLNQAKGNTWGAGAGGRADKIMLGALQGVSTVQKAVGMDTTTGLVAETKDTLASSIGQVEQARGAAMAEETRIANEKIAKMEAETAEINKRNAEMIKRTLEDIAKSKASDPFQ